MIDRLIACLNLLMPWEDFIFGLSAIQHITLTVSLSIIIGQLGQRISDLAIIVYPPLHDILFSDSLSSRLEYTFVVCKNPARPIASDSLSKKIKPTHLLGHAK